MMVFKFCRISNIHKTEKYRMQVLPTNKSVQVSIISIYFFSISILKVKIIYFFDSKTLLPRILSKISKVNYI